MGVKRKIQQTIKEAVKELDSEQLKKTTEIVLTRYAEQAYANALITMGVPVNSILLAIGYLKSGANFKDTIEQFKTFKTKRMFDEAEQVHEIGQPTQQYGKEYSKAVKQALEELAKSEAKYDGNISMRNIAEMTVRYEKTMQTIEDLKARGVNLVQSSRHANCSKRCEKWQGGYYTLDNTYQTVDGIQFQPLSNATDQFYTTKRGKVYKNGHITGYNCRHTLFPYKKGYSQPMVSAKTIERERAIDQKMRYLERQIRLWKDTALMYKGQNQKNYEKARLRATKYNNVYIEFAKKNKRAFYPNRTEIY